MSHKQPRLEQVELLCCEACRSTMVFVHGPPRDLAYHFPEPVKCRHCGRDMDRETLSLAHLILARLLMWF